MSRLRLSVLLLFSFLVVPCTTLAFQGGIISQHVYSVTGNVYLGDTSHPAANVIVVLRGAEGSDIADVGTNESGIFSIVDLKPATYSLEIDVQGYTRVVTSLDLNYSAVRGLQIILQPEATGITSQHASAISSHELSMPKKARDLMASGKVKFYEQHDAAGGIEDFQLAMAVAPNYYEAEYQTAMAYLSQGKREEAEKSFRQSIALSGEKYGEGYVGLGTLALDRKDNAEAEKNLRKGTELSPDFWVGHYELARVLFVDGRNDEALKAAEQARSLAPGAPIIYRLLTRIHLRAHDYRAAEEDLDTYLKLDPDSPAGRRAKELREEVAQKVDAQPVAPAADTAPKLQR